MKCPKCKSKSKTVWVRHKDTFTVRKRQCLKCNRKFSTKEMLDDGWNYKIVVDNIYEELRKLKRK